MPTIVSSSTESDRETVLGWLREYNHSENGPFMTALSNDAEKEFFHVARDDEENPVGGLQGVTLFSWLRIDIMAVSPPNRGQGIGRQLVEKAEEIARHANCTFAYVDTLSFQAPAFYQNLGYREAGRLPNWDSHGHDKIFFIKPLTPP